MFFTPRSGEKCAIPNNAPCSTMAAATGMRDRKPRSTMPRKMISSMIGAATTDRISNVIT